MPLPFKPALAKLTDKILVGNYAYQQKYDGYRLIASKSILASRTGEDWSIRFASISEAVEALGLPDDTLLDGEVVIFDEHGVPSFEKLHASEGEPVFLVFDVPSHPGTLQERLDWLESTLPKDGLVRVAPYSYEPWDACACGQEGLILKNLDQKYPFGERQWLKYKCTQEQEFVVLGYTSPTGKRTHLGALLVGYYNDAGDIQYAGRVGTGYSDRTLAELGPKLQALGPGESFAKVKGSTWVEPKLVAQVKFMNWTKDGKLRHPSFVSLRDDKQPRDVVRETVEVLAHS
jgi:bifunctional non-homologous end joining protein LigD